MPSSSFTFPLLFFCHSLIVILCFAYVFASKRRKIHSFVNKIAKKCAKIWSIQIIVVPLQPLLRNKASSIGIIMPDSETGIEAPTSDVTNSASASIYNLHGQSLKSPRPGINIINGKKMIVK